MQYFNTLRTALISAFAFAAIASPASACVTSVWTKTGGDSFAEKIEGKDCGGTMSVRMTGGFGDTGWIPMFKNGTSDFMAQYGDGRVLTDIHMKVDGLTMKGSFHHKAATGATTTQGTYVLTGL
ncbi:hypothetical protein [Halovulum sp. GXIMD14793]